MSGEGGVSLDGGIAQAYARAKCAPLPPMKANRHGLCQLFPRGRNIIRLSSLERHGTTCARFTPWARILLGNSGVPNNRMVQTNERTKMSALNRRAFFVKLGRVGKFKRSVSWWHRSKTGI